MERIPRFKRAMVNPGKLINKLGKGAPRLDRRTFQLAKYLPKLIPPAPLEVSWVTKVPIWPMYLNDQLGDCVAAASAHMINQWTNYALGTEVFPTDQDVLKSYEVVGGYVSGDPLTDNGMAMLDYLNYWRKFGLGQHKILAYASVDVARKDQIMQSIYLFGNLYLGIQLPISVQGHNSWTVAEGGPFADGSPGSWGGHCIPVVAASPKSLTVITWGQTLKMSWNFLHDCADEAYCVLSQDWIEKNKLSPGNFDLATLMDDLKQL